MGFFPIHSLVPMRYFAIGGRADEVFCYIGFYIELSECESK